MFTNRILNGAIVLSLIAILPFLGSQAPVQAKALDIIVNTTSDVADFSGARQVGDLPGPDGLVSLREAIIAANNTPGPQVIAFHIPTTDPGFGDSMFTIMPLTPPPALTGGETTIDGSTQTAFTGDTNPLGPEIVINGSLMQPDPDDTVREVNGFEIRSPNNRIHSLVINGIRDMDGKSGTGIQIQGTGVSGNRVTGCFIGTDATGSSAVSNEGYGLIIGGNATHNTIGGPTPQDCNILSGNLGRGIAISGQGADFNTVQGNFIGTDVSGTRAILNGAVPDDVGGGMSISYGAAHNMVVGNLISGNRHIGLQFNRGAHDNAAIDNRIGTDITGLNSLPNTRAGIATGWDGNVSLNNRIEGNTIAYNRQSGISVALGTGVSIRRNRIFSNRSLGIDLGNDGVTPNDPGDADTGPNNLMNYPVLTSAQTTPGRLIVKGTIDTPNPRTVTIEFFANPVPVPGGDPSGYGEGAVYLGSVRPNPQGIFTAPLPPVPAGTLISATATDADGNTSEFCKNIAVVTQPQPKAGELYVDASARAGGNGSRARPFKTIQAAIDAAQSNDTIKVAWGTYNENLVINGKALTLQGGYKPNAWELGGKVEDTVIDGGERGHTIMIIYGARVGLEGFLVTKGRISENELAAGGGILVYGSTTEAIIQRVIVRNNIAEWPCGGGGIEVSDGATTFVINSIVSGNTARHGAGINAYSDSSDSQVFVINSTITGNQPDGVDGQNNHAVLWNTIAWGNGDNGDSDVLGNVDAYYSLIGVDPLFVDAAHGNYHLSAGSPAIDAGTSVGAPSADIDGDPRPMGAGVDIGADEFRP